MFRSTTAAVMAAIIKESQLEIEFAKMRGNHYSVSLIGSTDKGAFRGSPPLPQILLRLSLKTLFWMNLSGTVPDNIIDIKGLFLTILLT